MSSNPKRVTARNRDQIAARPRYYRGAAAGTTSARPERMRARAIAVGQGAGPVSHPTDHVATVARTNWVVIANLNELPAREPATE